MQRFCGAIRSSCLKSTPRPIKPSRPTRWRHPADDLTGREVKTPPRGRRHGNMIVLGIETSCDETAAAIVAATASGPRILSNLVQSQLAAHMPFGGVVPEIA